MMGQCYYSRLVGMVGLMYLVMVVWGVMAACTPQQARTMAVDAAALSAVAVLTHTQYEDAVAAVERNVGLFSAEERAALRRVRERLDWVHETVDGLTQGRDVGQVLIELAQLRSLIAETEEAYLDAREIVGRHLDDFPTADRLVVLQFEAKADRLRERWRRQMEAGSGGTGDDAVNATQMLLDILTVAGGVAKVIAPLVL